MHEEAQPVSSLLHCALDFTDPSEAFRCEEEFAAVSVDGGDNYVKHAAWSPDGSAFLSSSRDAVVRVFGLPASYVLGAFGGPAVPMHSRCTVQCPEVRDEIVVGSIFAFVLTHSRGVAGHL